MGEELEKDGLAQKQWLEDVKEIVDRLREEVAQVHARGAPTVGAKRFLTELQERLKELKTTLVDMKRSP